MKEEKRPTFDYQDADKRSALPGKGGRNVTHLLWSAKKAFKHWCSALKHNIRRGTELRENFALRPNKKRAGSFTHDTFLLQGSRQRVKELRQREDLGITKKRGGGDKRTSCVGVWR